MFTVTIIGRPNVGKSTLFNSLVGKKSALVYDFPGVTRDRKEEQVNFLGLEFKLIDTAGFETDSSKILAKELVQQIDHAVEEADLLLFLLDAKSGIIAADYEFIEYIRKKSKDVVLIVNKAEVKSKKIDNNQLYKFGFKEIIHISSGQRLGYDDLYSKIEYHYNLYQDKYGIFESKLKEKGVRIAVVGKPNVGKSTFINSLLKEDRLITSDESGTTRDSIEISWQYNDENIILVDTAGIRKRNKVQQVLDKLSYQDSLRSVRFANVAILILDATQKKFEKQDVWVASHIVGEGRGLVVVLNKIDLLSKAELDEAKSEIEYQIGKYLPQNKELQIIPITATKGRNIIKVIDSAIFVYKNWDVRITTKKINDWLSYAVSEHRPKMHKGREVRLKYITQIKSRPPTFVIMTNQPNAISDAYLRYLKNSLIETFKLSGTTIRIILKKVANPYNNRKGFKSEKK